MKSFINYPENSDFSIHNIPFGVAVFNKEYIACATRIGDIVVDLATLYDFGYFTDIEGLNDNVFEAYTLNEFIELGKPITNAVRLKLQQLFLEDSLLSKDEKTIEECFFQIDEVKMLMPLHIPNFTEFCGSASHAKNLNHIFGTSSNNDRWKHLPMGSHGRASSIVVTGTDIHRPKGQIMNRDSELPILAPTQKLDFELEMAFVVNANTEIGEGIPISEAKNYIFGMVLFNDWSARDFQEWETGTFNALIGKNFASSISPWVVTLEALEPFAVLKNTVQTELLDYLKTEESTTYDIHLQASITPRKGTEFIVCKTNYQALYWDMQQQLAHHTISGCNIEVGDLYAMGAISGEEEHSFASMLERTENGTKPIVLNDGQKRQFLEDTDTLTIRGWAEKDGIRIGFGEIQDTILPSL